MNGRVVLEGHLQEYDGVKGNTESVHISSLDAVRSGGPLHHIWGGVALGSSEIFRPLADVLGASQVNQG
jgi:hypothetical protein